MAKNRLRDLRDHLFETLEGLKDKEEPMDIRRAQAVASVANAIIASAKVELSFMRSMDRQGESDFWLSDGRKEQLAIPAASVRPPVAAPPTPPPKDEADDEAEPAKAGAAGLALWLPCLTCGEKFPDAKALGIHQTRVHFTNEPAMARRSGA